MRPLPDDSSGLPPRPMGWSEADDRRFGFSGSEEWLDHAAEATAPQPLGSIGDYELYEEIGRGGQGVVYRARQPGVSRDIAVKRLIEGAFATPRARRRFEREIEAAASLQHPGIVTVYGMEIVDGQPVLAMEWVDGVPVTDWARAEPRPTSQAVLEVFGRLCDAVRHAHRHGILHRDLKPGNILIDSDGRPRVLDFGLARPLADRDSLTTSPGEFAGTLSYASPEQIEGLTTLDARSDVYSLGVILYEMVTGARPRQPEAGVREFFEALDREAFTPPSSVRREIRRDFDAIAHTALARRREDRYGSVAELAEDVRRYRAGHAVLAHPPSLRYELGKLARRHRGVVTLAALLLVTVLGFAGVTYRQATLLARERNAEATARGAAEDAEGRASSEADAATAMLNFFLNDVLLQSARPGQLGMTLVESLDTAIERVDERFEDRPLVAARVHRRIGQVLRAHGRFAAALQQVELALTRLKDHGIDDPHHLGHGEISLGVALIQTGEPKRAVEHLQNAVRHFAAKVPTDHEQLSRAHRCVAEAQLQSGDHAGAQDSFETSMRIAREQLADPNDAISWNLAGIARCMALQGDSEGARQRTTELLAFNREHFGDRSENVGQTLETLAMLDMEFGDVDAAIPRCREATEILSEVFGPDHPTPAHTRATLAAMLGGRGDHDDAIAEFEEALRVLRDRRGPDSPIVATIETDLAKSLLALDRTAAAIQLLEPAVRVLTARFGEASRWTANATSLLKQATAASAERSADGGD
ncbi:MAG: serine/threonine-protein kinase [Planctomycetota bacterium]